VKDDFEVLWREAIVTVDANVLLNLYRYSSETRQELERSLRLVSDRIFIPHQAAKEFLNNRLRVTAEQANEYREAIKNLTGLYTTLSNQKRHPFLTGSELDGTRSPPLP
jgi:predicted nucleic acid-binding protein